MVAIDGLVQPRLRIHKMESSWADIWIGQVEGHAIDYAYGGTRMVAPGTTDDDAVEVVRDLAINESLLKNLLINSAIEDGAVDHLGGALPPGFAESRVGGARCIIRPREEAVHRVLNDPGHPDFAQYVRPVFAEIGRALNDLDGQVKLTPDFGRFASLSDMLHEFTPHVLGIRCEAGGCGGKTSYATTGVAAAFEHFGPAADTPVTLIGAAGAMGSEFLTYLTAGGFSDVAVSDIAYQATDRKPQPAFPRLEARPGAFTPECLSRPGIVVATTWGRELENSDLSALRPGGHLLLAHNLSIPTGHAGVRLVQQVAELGVTALPGQILTLGGALTARVEWFWRQSRPGQDFDKPLAHQVVRAVVGHWVGRCMTVAKRQDITPYEAMLEAVPTVLA